MENREDGVVKFIAGLAIGALAGMTTGLMMADRPGRELRKDLEINSSELMSNLKDRLEDIKEEANVKIKDFKGFADEKLRASAINIQEQAASLGTQLEELTKKKPEGQEILN